MYIHVLYAYMYIHTYIYIYIQLYNYIYTYYIYTHTQYISITQPLCCSPLNPWPRCHRCGWRGEDTTGGAPKGAEVQEVFRRHGWVFLDAMIYIYNIYIFIYQYTIIYVSIYLLYDDLFTLHIYITIYIILLYIIYLVLSICIV